MSHVRSNRSVSLLALTLIWTTPVSLSAQAQGTGIREVSASARSLIPLQTRLRYTTMVVLPEGEEILDVICGDKDFWVISSTHNIAHVKPAKEGAATNMNLVTASGAVYSFLLTEKSGNGMPDLKVYVNADPNAPQGKPKYYSAAQVEDLQAELAEAKAEVDAANRRATESIADVSAAVSGEVAVRLRLRRSTKSRSSSARSGTTASSPTSRRTRPSCRRSMRSKTASRPC